MNRFSATKWWLIPSLLLVGLIMLAILMPRSNPSYGEVINEDQAKKIIPMLIGSWDMSKSPHRYAVFLELRQKETPYPGYFSGMNEQGRIEIKPQHNFLDGQIDFNSEAAFTVHLTQTSRKYGMEHQIPGGIWMADLRENPIKVEITAISDLTLVPPDRKGNQPLIATGKAKGRLHVAAGKALAISSEVRVTYDEELPVIRLEFKFTFQGKDAGFPEKLAGPVQATLHTVTVPSHIKAPDPIETMPDLRLR